RVGDAVAVAEDPVIQCGGGEVLVVGDVRQVKLGEKPVLDRGVTLRGIGDDEVERRLPLGRRLQLRDRVPPAGIEDDRRPGFFLKPRHKGLTHRLLMAARVDEYTQLLPGKWTGLCTSVTAADYRVGGQCRGTQQEPAAGH